MYPGHVQQDVVEAARGGPQGQRPVPLQARREGADSEALPAPGEPRVERPADLLAEERQNHRAGVRRGASRRGGHGAPLHLFPVPQEPRGPGQVVFWVLPVLRELPGARHLDGAHQELQDLGPQDGSEQEGGATGVRGGQGPGGGDPGGAGALEPARRANRGRARILQGRGRRAEAPAAGDRPEGEGEEGGRGARGRPERGRRRSGGAGPALRPHGGAQGGSELFRRPGRLLIPRARRVRQPGLQQPGRRPIRVRGGGDLRGVRRRARGGGGATAKKRATRASTAAAGQCRARSSCTKSKRTTTTSLER